MSYADKVQSLSLRLDKVAGEGVTVDRKDICKLIEICEQNDVPVMGYHGALFSYFLIIFDKDTPALVGVDRRKVAVMLAKQFAYMTMGLIAGINIMVDKAIQDVILDTVEYDSLTPDHAVTLLGNSESLKYYRTMVSRAIRNVRAAEGKEQF